MSSRSSWDTYSDFIFKKKKAGIVAVHAYNPNTQEAETRELLQVQSQSSLQSESVTGSLSQLHTHDK